VGKAAVHAAIVPDMVPSCVVPSYVVTATLCRDIGRCRLDILLGRRKLFVCESRNGEPEGRSAGKRNNKHFHFRSPNCVNSFVLIRHALSLRTRAPGERPRPVFSNRGPGPGVGDNWGGHGNARFVQIRQDRAWRLSKIEHSPRPGMRSNVARNEARGPRRPTWSIKTKAPRKPERSQSSSGPQAATFPQAATLVGLTSRSLLELAIGIARGFIASGISRTRSTCRSPFSRLAPFT
jgi:hypothetical protein